jgi:pimeloyl-ACP methyl ester carboxylesterase
MESARRLTTSDGAELAYWLWRSRSKPSEPLLLVHGAASNHTRWSEFLEGTELKASWDVLRPDMRGNGESLTRGRLDTAIWCRDLGEILDAEAYPSALLIGHSLGAQIAAHFASRYPDKTLGLVLIDPVFRGALTGSRRRISRTRLLFALAVWLIRALNRLGIRRRHIPDRDLRELDEETRAALRGGSSYQEIAKRYSSLRLILAHMPTANYLQQLIETVAPLPPLVEIRCPVLVLLSTGITFADAAINRAEIGKFPRADLVEIDANHWPLTEKPDDVRQAIEAWVKATFPRQPTGPRG